MRQPPVPPDVAEILDRLRAACGDRLVVVVFFGSRYLGTSPDRYSAADLLVVTDDLRGFYEGMRAYGLSRRSPAVSAFLGRVLPPNIHYVDGGTGGAKIFVLDHRDFIRALSEKSRDHFVRGRFSQAVGIVLARTEKIRERTVRLLDGGRSLTVDWVPLFLPERFTVEEYCRTMLRVSYAGEIRPESEDRFAEVFEAQKESLIPLYEDILEGGIRDGRLRQDGSAFLMEERPTTARRMAVRWFFLRSKTRATARWFKYVYTFDGWLDYIVRKVERRTGLRVELTPAERRWPFIFGWPRVWQVLRARRSGRRRIESGGER